MKIFIGLLLIGISACSPYIADNKYVAHKLVKTESVSVKFDLILDEEITEDDPRIKSIMYSSRQKSYVVINYYNINAEHLANKIAMILTQYKVILKKPELYYGNKVFEKYIVVYIKYK